jgi:hypothetical protein
MDSDFCQREKGVEANLNNIPAAIMDTERIGREIRGRNSGICFAPSGIFINGMEASGDNVPELLRNSSLYVEFLAGREEILRHKWIESEKAGYDIGFERALLDWTIKHRSAWRQHRKKASQEAISSLPAGNKTS